MFPKMHLFSLIGDDYEIQYSEEQRCITLHNKIFAQVGQNLKQLNGEIRKGANTLRKVLFFCCVTFVLSFQVHEEADGI